MVSRIHTLTHTHTTIIYKQIQELQTRLAQKDEVLFELEASTSLAQTESAHKTKVAQSEAFKRINIVEEELRRTRLESDKYKNSLVRSKKRVAELESQNRINGVVGNGGGVNQGNNNNNNLGYNATSNNKKWDQHGLAGPPPPQQQKNQMQIEQFSGLLSFD